MNFLYCWELGGGLGHLVNAKAVAELFFEREATVDIAACRFREAASFFSESKIIVHPAPRYLPRIRNRHLPQSYADILYQRGWGGIQELSGLVDDWQSLYQRLQPDVIFFDYAPTALLAARGMNVARYVIGSGFGSMRPGTPLQGFNNRVPQKLLERQERKMVALVNELCESRNIPAVRYISDLYDSEGSLLTNFNELDLESDRKGATYLGPLDSYCSEVSASGEESPDIFAYLKAEYSGLRNMLRALVTTRTSVHVFCPALPESLRREFEHIIRFSEQMYDLDKVLKNAKILVCHGGPGTLCQGIRAGVPIVVAPLQFEQNQYAEIIQKKSLGAKVPLGASEKVIASIFDDLMWEPRYHHAIKRVQSRYTNWTPGLLLQEVVDRIIESIENQDTLRISE